MKKFENFCRALDNLTEIERYHPPYDTVVLTGLVALYQICFEQAWKAMKETLEQSGVETAASGSPRMIIKEAYRLGMIHDEDAWLNALVARNHASHAYNGGNPKFCVTAKTGANREKFIMGGRREKRLPPC